MSDTTARDRLAQIIEDHYYDGRSGWISYENRQKAIERMTDAILAAGFRPPAASLTDFTSTSSAVTTVSTDTATDMT